MEVYESHMGGIFFEDRVLDYDEIYCEQCGDCDQYLGHADTWEEVIPMLQWSYGEFKYEDKYIKELEAEFNAYSYNRRK